MFKFALLIAAVGFGSFGVAVLMLRKVVTDQRDIYEDALRKRAEESRRLRAMNSRLSDINGKLQAKLNTERVNKPQEEFLDVPRGKAPFKTANIENGGF